MDGPQENPGALEAQQRAALRRRYLRALLIWVPLAACAACLVVALVALPSMDNPLLPVTGGRAPVHDIPVAPTLTPGPTRQPEPAPVVPPNTIFSYKEEALSRLADCSSAFHDFFLIEQLALHQPEMIQEENWRSQASTAMQFFEHDCAPLGEMQDVPTAYGEVDRWLKLAAGEVDSASGVFHDMLDAQDMRQIGVITDHMLRFIEFTHNAESIIDRLERRKQI